MEEILTKAVQDYLKFHDHSGHNYALAMKSFTDHLTEVYKVYLVIVGEGSVIIILDCPTLDSLEHLWRDYRAGHLDKVAERYLVTDEIKEKLKLEANCLKTTIAEENYLNCKKALMKLPSTRSGEFMQSVWEVQLYCISRVTLERGLSVSRVYNLQVVDGKKCSDDYNNRHHHHNDAADDDNIIDCNLYSSKGALHYWKLKHGKNHKDTRMYALLDTLHVKYWIF